MISPKLRFQILHRMESDTAMLCDWKQLFNSNGCFVWMRFVFTMSVGSAIVAYSCRSLPSYHAAIWQSYVMVRPAEMGM